MIVSVLASCGSDGDDRDPSLQATDVADTVGIAQPSRTHGENCVADLDGDGLTDLLLSAHSDPWQLYMGQPDGRFVRSNNIVFEPRDRHGCAVADFDTDGLLDIYVSIGACRGMCTNPKELWIQQDDHTFIDAAEAWGVSDPGGRGRVPVVLDANGDELPDLFTGAEEAVSIGGSHVYDAALPYTDIFYLTLVHEHTPGDTKIDINLCGLVSRACPLVREAHELGTEQGIVASPAAYANDPC